MKIRNMPWLELVAAVGISVMAFTVVVLFFPTMNSEVAAAWVQAIGSVAAILAAVAIANQQHARERTLESERLVSDERRRILAVEALLDTAHALCETIRDKWSDRGTRKAAFHPSTLAYLDHCKAAIASVPPLEIPLQELMFYVLALPRNLQDLRDLLTKVPKDGVARVILEESVVESVASQINDTLKVVREAADICDSAIKARGGRM